MQKLKRPKGKQPFIPERQEGLKWSSSETQEGSSGKFRGLEGSFDGKGEENTSLKAIPIVPTPDPQSQSGSKLFKQLRRPKGFSRMSTHIPGTCICLEMCSNEKTSPASANAYPAVKPNQRIRSKEDHAQLLSCRIESWRQLNSLCILLDVKRLSNSTPTSPTSPPSIFSYQEAVCPGSCGRNGQSFPPSFGWMERTCIGPW